MLYNKVDEYARIIFPNRATIWQHLALKRDDYLLKEALDRGRIDEVLVSFKRWDAEPRVQNHAHLFEVDFVLSVIACIYKVIKANPSRFREPTEGLENQCVWGIHHEDWQRAHAVIWFVKRRRSRAGRCPQVGPDKYKGYCAINVGPYAYATLDVMASVAARQWNMAGNGVDEYVSSMDDL